MSDLDIAVGKILDEGDDVELEKEQDATVGAKYSARNPTYKIPEPSQGDVIALLREAIKLHTTRNTALGSLNADSASCSTNSLNLVADLASYSTNSVKLVADPAKSCCSSNNVSNTFTVDSAIPFGTNSGTQCANKNSDKDYLNDISLEYKNIERKRPLLNDKLTNMFQDLIWNNTKPEKIDNLLKSVLPPRKY